MTDGKRFEDKVEIADLIKQPQKEILARIYQQVLKTNGTVAQNCKDIISLQDDMKDKIGMKLFRNLSIIIGLMIAAATLIQIFVK
jgi:hypothetical protein